MRFDENKFLSKVDIKSDDECWYWASTKFPNGYGRFKFKEDGRWRDLLAHRVSYEIKNGEIPKGLVICHKCDNRSCVNPNHLFAGTQAQNLADMDRKGRRVNYDKSGERNPSSKLTKEQVIEIRNKYVPKVYTGRMLAEEYGVSIPLIEKILSRRVWKEV